MKYIKNQLFPKNDENTFLEKLITFLTSRRSYHAAPTKFRNQKKLYYQ